MPPGPTGAVSATPPLHDRTKDHWRPLVGPAVLRPQGAAAGLLLKRESGPSPGLITRAPLSPSAARSISENRPTRALSTRSAKHVGVRSSTSYYTLNIPR